MLYASFVQEQMTTCKQMLWRILFCCLTEKMYSQAFCQLKCFLLTVGLKTSFDNLCFLLSPAVCYCSPFLRSVTSPLSWVCLWNRLSYRFSHCALPNRLLNLLSVLQLAKMQSYTGIAFWISESSFCPFFAPKALCYFCLLFWTSSLPSMPFCMIVCCFLVLITLRAHY